MKFHSESLYHLSTDIPDERSVFVFPNEKSTYGDIRSLVVENEKVLTDLTNKNIAIVGKSRYEFAHLLFCLDGIANRILFLPRDIDQALRDDYCKQANIDSSVSFVERKIIVEDIEFSNDTPHSESQTNGKLTEWIIPTSGTTKSPKLVVHNIASLSRTAKLDIDKGKHYVWGMIYDIYRFAGVQVYLQSILAGSTLAIPENDMEANQMLAFFADKSCNTLSATPSFWRKALMLPSINNLNLTNITLGGEIVDEQILTLLRRQFPVAKIRHIYASTEAGVGFSVTDGKAGFPLDYLNNSKASIQLKINDGLLWIKPKTSEQHYLSGQEMFEESGYISTGDLVEIREDRVYFLGRESGAINVGGNKVQPEEVENIILASGLVNQVRVYAKTNPVMGNLVMADIVVSMELVSDKSSAKKEVLEYCKHHLTDYKVPALIKVVDSIEITTSGKLKRG